MSNVGFSVDDGIGVVEINRAEALNAVDLPMKEAIIEELRAFRADNEVRVVLFRSEGEQAFSAGGDINEVRELDFALRPFTESWGELFDVMWNLGKPTVARVEGFALGGGFDLLLHTDFVIAAEDATLGQPEVGLGIVNHFSPPLLIEMVGFRQAMDLMMTGEPISGKRAERIGLVSRSVPAEKLDDEVESVIDSLTEKSPRILRKLKDGMYTALELSPRAGQDYLESIALESARTDPDYREGVQAQLDGRDPDWPE